MCVPCHSLANDRPDASCAGEMPLLGKPIDEADVHVMIEPEYFNRVFYSVAGQKVFVIRLLHERQS